MDDQKIIDLYWSRSESAIAETDRKYGKYCYSIAFNILTNKEDAEERVSDTYMAAWKAMPPKRPSILATFLGKITRRLSIDIWRKRNRQKRGGGELTLMLSELSEVLEDSVAEQTEEGAIGTVIDAFLRTLPKTERVVFVRRYFYGCSIAEIAKECGVGSSKIKSMLHRTRQKLRVRLQKEGINI